MLVYPLIFIISLISILLAVEIVWLTEKNLDVSYKFFMFGAIVLAILFGLKSLTVFGVLIDEKIFYALELIFVFLFLDGLFFMRKLVKNIIKERKK